MCVRVRVWCDVMCAWRTRIRAHTSTLALQTLHTPNPIARAHTVGPKRVIPRIAETLKMAKESFAEAGVKAAQPKVPSGGAASDAAAQAPKPRSPEAADGATKPKKVD